MKDKIVVVGNPLFGKALSAAVMDLKNLPQEASEAKDLQEILEEQRSIPITIQHIPLVDTPKSGKQLRRERRAKERKLKQKNK